MDPKKKVNPVTYNILLEERLNVRAAELGCDKESDWLGCQSCDKYDECVAKVSE